MNTAISKRPIYYSYTQSAEDYNKLRFSCKLLYFYDLLFVLIYFLKILYFFNLKYVFIIKISIYLSAITVSQLNWQIFVLWNNSCTNFWVANFRSNVAFYIPFFLGFEIPPCHS